MAVFDRGDIVSLPLDPAMGHEQRGTRPALVLTTREFNKLGDVLVAPITQGVNIGMEPYLGIVQKGATLNDYEYLVQSRKAMFDHLVWWGRVLKAARQVEGAKSGLAA